MITTKVHPEAVILSVLVQAAYGEDSQWIEECRRRYASTAKVDFVELKKDILWLHGTLRELGWTDNQIIQLCYDCDKHYLAVKVGGTAGLPQLLALGHARRWTASILGWVLGFEQGTWDHPALQAHIHPAKTWVCEPVPNVVYSGTDAGVIAMRYCMRRIQIWGPLSRDELKRYGGFSDAELDYWLGLLPGNKS